MTTSKRPSDAEPGDPRGHEATLAANLRKDQVRAALFGAAKTPQRVGRYVVEEILGEGAMGTVFLGFDPQLDRHVAIKQIKGDDDDARRARMLREAQALARLSHPNVVPVYEVGEHEGRLFFAMERVKGTSLHAWQQAQDHGWRTVVEHYMQAGRGLAAAHAVGLVHRDFKPHNAVVGDDGRVRVLDFGVAGTDRKRVAVDEANVTASATDSKQDWIRTPLTSTGAVVGTPAYMAPEQLHGSEVSHHADQYAFCVALYEGLYGRRPIDMAGVRRMLAGDRIEAAPPPAGTAVPRRVWATLQRGLSPEPEARFESMEALLVALDPSRARRRRVVMAAGVVGTGLLGALAMAGDREQPCLPDPTALADAWNDERRAEIREAFAATGLPFAETTADYAEQTLQSWSDTWVQARSDACRAARVDQVETETRMEARMACLERQRQVLGAFTEVLAEADGKTVGRADEVLAGLPDVAACAQSELAEGRYPMPHDADVVERIEAAHKDIATAQAMANAGARNAAERLARDVLSRTDDLEYPPLELRAKWLDGKLSLARGSLDDTIPAQLATAWRAESLRLDDLVATIRVRIAEEAVGQWSRPQQEEWLLSAAEASVIRVGRSGDPRTTRLALLRARQLWRTGDLSGARAHLEELLGTAPVEIATSIRFELARSLLDAGLLDDAAQAFSDARDHAIESMGPRSRRVANAEFNLGLVALARGDVAAAAQHNAEASRIHTSVFGPDSIGAARAAFTSAKIAMNRGDFERAKRLLSSVLRVYERKLGVHALETAQALEAQGALLFYLGDHADALVSYRQALDTKKRILGDDHVQVALTKANIGETELVVGRHEQALETLDEAISVLDGTSKNSPMLALALKGRGMAQLATGDTESAVESLETALELYREFAGEPLEYADTAFALARAVLPDEPDRARTLAVLATEELAAAGILDRAEEIRIWIDRKNLATGQKEARQ